MHFAINATQPICFFPCLSDVRSVSHQGAPSINVNGNNCIVFVDTTSNTPCCDSYKYTLGKQHCMEATFLEDISQRLRRKSNAMESAADFLGLKRH